MQYLNVDLPDDVKSYVDAGYFNKARGLIALYLDRNISSILKERLEFELVRIKVLEKNYVYSFREAYELCDKKIENFTEAELHYLIDERYADWIFIEGEIKLSKRFLSNTIKVHPNVKDRLLVKEPTDISGDLRKKVVNEIIEKGSKSYFIHLKTGIRVKPDNEVKGNKIKVHIPIPKNSQQTKNIKIHLASPEYKEISSEGHPQRTLYFEEDLKDENLFAVEYSFENHIKYKNLDYNLVSKVQPKFYTNQELPHVKFSPFLVDLTNEIIHDEINPLKKARLIYDYITQNVQYSFMRPYISILSIAEYCAYNLKGDCGVQAILFITLCRIAGIPARWQSGLYVNPHFIGCHDWAEFYIEPYGWLFADPSFGGGAHRNNDMVGWNFYFGNLDPFRMVANDAFHYPLYPEKNFLRSDPYDNQTGEAETELMNLNEYTENILEIIDIHEI